MTPSQVAQDIGAQMYLSDSDGGAQLYYRWKTSINNIDEVCHCLCYHSSFGTWQASDVRDQLNYAAERLTWIAGVPPYDREVAECEARLLELTRMGELEYKRITDLRKANRKHT